MVFWIAFVFFACFIAVIASGKNIRTIVSDLNVYVCNAVIIYAMQHANVKKNEATQSEATISGRTLHIKYTLHGKGYEIYVPYNRRASHLRKFRIVYEDGTVADYHNHPCVDLVVEAHHLHARSVEIYNDHKSMI